MGVKSETGTNFDLHQDRLDSEYVNFSNKYLIKERSFGRQYCVYYVQRLNLMREKLQKSAEQKWGDNVKLAKLSDTDEDEEVCVVGTIFKHMELQRSILKEISLERNLVFQPIRMRYTSDTDKLYLEDETQRTAIIGNDYVKAQDFVTGIVVALKGKVVNGVFNVSDICLPSLPEYIERPIPEDDKYVAFVSGLTLARSADSLAPLSQLVSLLTGDCDEPLVELGCKIVRLIIAGNSVSHVVDESRKTNKYLNKKTAAGSVEGVEILDDILRDLSSAISVDVMAGENDPCSKLLPQQPLHPCIFPKASRSSAFKTVTNPYEFSIDGTRFLGTSGQNITSLTHYTTMDDPIKIMEATLNWGHIVPTAPDVLISYPFQENDPFILTSRPHVYFAGNQPSFEAKVSKGKDGHPICLISIPPFHKSFSCVLLNLKNLECHSLDFTTNL